MVPWATMSRKLRRVQVPLTPDVAEALRVEHATNAERGIKLNDAAALVAIVTRAARVLQAAKSAREAAK